MLICIRWVQPVSAAHRAYPIPWRSGRGGHRGSPQAAAAEGYRLSTRATAGNRRCDRNRNGRDPADRYQTGRELAEAAARALGVKAHSQAPISVSPRESPRPMIEIAAQTSALRRKPLVLGLGAAAIILIGVLIGALVLSRGPSGGGSDASRDTPAEPLVEPGALPRLLLSEAKITSIPRYADAPGGLNQSAHRLLPEDRQHRVRGSIRTDRTIHLRRKRLHRTGGQRFHSRQPRPEAWRHPSSRQWWPIHRQTPPSLPVTARWISGVNVPSAAQSARWIRVTQSAEVKFADVVVTDDDVALLAQAVGPSGVACDRGLGVKNNVVIDSIVCQADSATQQVLDLVRDITAEVA